MARDIQKAHLASCLAQRLRGRLPLSEIRRGQACHIYQGKRFESGVCVIGRNACRHQDHLFEVIQSDLVVQMKNRPLRYRPGRPGK